MLSNSSEPTQQRAVLSRADRQNEIEDITVLHLEDSDLDAAFVENWLQKSGLPVRVQRAIDRDSFINELKSKPFGVILSDYQVPTFEGFAALELASEHQPETPFIFVSGTMGEELAVETLKRGATDYVLKDNLARLPAAVQRAIAESRARHQRLAAELAAQQANERAASILESITDSFFTLDHEWRFVYANPQAERTLQRRPGELLGKVVWEAFPQLCGTVFEETYRRVAQTRTAESVTAYYPDHGCWYEARAFPSAEGLSVYFQDVSERVRAEEQLRRVAIAEKQRSALLARVAEASRSINSVLSANSIARILTEEACAIINARVGMTTFNQREDWNSPIQSSGVVARICAAGADSDDIRSAVALTGEVAAEQPEFDAALAAAVCSQGYPQRVSRAESGPQRWGRLAVPLLGHGGKSLGVVQVADKLDGEFTLEDEAILVQLAAIAAVGIENARLYEQVREQDRRKDEFLATLAHELRNPLAPIRTGLTVLKLVKSPEDMNAAREMMERQVGHMVRLIDDLLDVSRITRGKVELKPERVDIRDVIDAALEVTRPIVEANNHELIIAPLDQALPIHADPTRIAQVISNLLNNAAKYTPRGGRIELTVERDGSHVEIAVRDNGLGIAPEMLHKVFEMFTQVGRTIDQAQGGLGIGLALVTRLVEMHGGTVKAESEGHGKGSRFIVRLPLAEAPVTAEITGVKATIAESPTPRRILVVDDNVDGAKSLSLLLNLAGHTTSVAYSGPAALERARSFAPEVVFLDIGLPGMNGYEVARQLRAEPNGAALTLVALTGWGTDDDRKRAHDAGFDHHLTKPVDAAHVHALLAAMSAARQT